MPFETADGILKPIVYFGAVRDDSILLAQYESPPNPDKAGWWIPAPEMEYGAHPRETARSIANSLGFADPEFDLFDVEGFVIGEAWHLLHHFRCSAAGEAEPDEQYARVSWFRREELPDASEFAHGRWERKLAEKFLRE